MGDWFDRWFEAYQIDPWGPERDDWRMRMLAAISGVPGKVEHLAYPSSFEQRKALRELIGDGEQQPLGSALAVMKGVIGGG